MADEHEHDHDHDHHGHDHDHDHGGGGAPTLTAVLEHLGPCKKLLKVEVPRSEVQKEFTSRLERLRKNVHLKGFRKGKAPKDRIEKLYGDAVLEDAREHLLRQSYMEAVKKELGADKVLGEGTIENVEFSRDVGLKYEVTFHTRPEFKLDSYKGIKVKMPALKVEEKDIDLAIDAFRRQKGELRPVEDPQAVVESEDLLSVDVQVWLADEFESWQKAQEEKVTAGTELKPLKEHFGLEVQLPGNQLGPYEVEDLADSLAGLKIGEWGEAEADLPDDYEVVEGRGEPAVLRIRVEAIRRMFLPELTEEWVQAAGHQSIADLRREIREQLQGRAEVARRSELENAILGALVQSVGEFELPTDLVDKEIESAEKRRTWELRMGGKSEREAEEMIEAERAEIRTEVERMLRHFFLVDEVARREGIKVTERDIEARIARLAASRGLQPRQVREELEKAQVMPQLVQDILDQKTRAALREQAEVEEVD